MSHLLDTNTCIQVIRTKGDPLVKARFSAADPADLRLCTVGLGELYHGAKRSADPVGERTKIDLFAAPIKCLDFDRAAAEEYADIRAYLEAQGTPIGPLDTQIAAIARAHGLTLVTHNTAEFSRVPGLQLVDWQLP
jgi:tRNA(fMet)-specific endonuclease VapC